HRCERHRRRGHTDRPRRGDGLQDARRTPCRAHLLWRWRHQHRDVPRIAEHGVDLAGAARDDHREQPVRRVLAPARHGADPGPRPRPRRLPPRTCKKTSTAPPLTQPKRPTQPSRRSPPMSTLTETRVADRTAAVVEMTYRDAINLALKDEMTADPSVVLLGEDVGVSGGVFKTNEGLAETFPGRVLNTPICENGFTSLALGMALLRM